MIDNVLPFVPKDQRERLTDDAAPLTAQELFGKLFTMSLHELDYLIRKFKSTGQWNDVAQQEMQLVIDHTRAVCSAVAHPPPSSPSTYTIQHGKETTTQVARKIPVITFGPGGRLRSNTDRIVGSTGGEHAADPPTTA